jgi:transposase-like protein
MPSADYLVREERIKQAIDVLNKREYTNVAECARKHGVKRRTLADRWKGRLSKSTRFAPNKRLTEAQEQAIVTYIKPNDEINLHLTPKFITAAANLVLGPEELPVSKNWTTRFLKRYPELRKRRQRPIPAVRKDAFHIEELEVYFKQLKHVCEEFGILTTDMWNMG